MKLYFYGHCFNHAPDKSSRGIISIMLPDLGAIYRTQFEGTQAECEYTAAIMAVRFVDNNKEVLPHQSMILLTDASELVDQVNDSKPSSNSIKMYRDTINMYLKKLAMSLAWVPRSENRAAQLISELPPLRIRLNMEFDFGQKGRDSTLTAHSIKLIL